MLKPLVLIVVCCLFFGCAQEQKLPKNFDYGSISNGVYTNDYFGMRFAFDDTWNVQSIEEMNTISEFGKDLINDEGIKRAAKANEVNSANLFAAFRYELDSVSSYNYSIAMVAENTKMFPKVKRGSDYLNEAKKIMQQTAINYTFDEAYASQIIGGKHFDVLSVTADYMGSIFKQKYMSTVDKGFSLTIIISYDTEAQLQELNALIDKISFTEGASKKKQ